MNLLFRDKEKFLRRRSHDQELYTDESLEILEKLAHEIFLRSAHLAATLSYASVCNRIDTKDEFQVALDSRLAWEVSFFWDEFVARSHELFPEGKKVVVKLVRPMELAEGEKISVPMIGAAFALNAFC